MIFTKAVQFQEIQKGLVASESEHFIEPLSPLSFFLVDTSIFVHRVWNEMQHLFIQNQLIEITYQRYALLVTNLVTW